MIMTSDEIQARLDSPQNLINQLKARLSGSVVVPFKTAEPEITEPNFDEILKDDDSVDDFDLRDKIRKNLIKSTAYDVLSSSLDNLKMRLDEASNPKDLSKIASDMSKIVGNLSDKTNAEAGNTNVVIYKPIIASESHYQTVVVHE